MDTARKVNTSTNKKLAQTLRVATTLYCARRKPELLHFFRVGRHAKSLRNRLLCMKHFLTDLTVPVHEQRVRNEFALWALPEDGSS